MMYYVGGTLHDEFLILLPKFFNYDEFSSYAGIVQKSYLGQILQRYYNFLTKNSFSLFDEYLKFYSHEYGSYELFIKKKYPILNSDEISEILSYINTGSYFLFRNIDNKVGDYKIANLSEFHDEFTEIIQDLLMEEYHENKK